eukprot:883034-Prymnesium_polylepis.1
MTGSGTGNVDHRAVYSDTWDSGRAVDVAVHTMFDDGRDGRAYLELGGTFYIGLRKPHRWGRCTA